MKRRTWILLGAAALGALVFSTWAERHGHCTRPPAAETSEVTAPAAPYASRRYAPPPAAPFERAPREGQAAETVGGILQIGPVSRGRAPQPSAPPEAETGGTWATSYSVAMCDCHTRACAESLQGQFIRAMGGVAYDEARDGAAYDQAVKRALECFHALPEGS